MRKSLALSILASGIGLMLAATMVVAVDGPAAEAQAGDRFDQDPPVTVQNPISDSFSDTYADPAIIRGKDGYWYLYATSDPLTEAPSEFGLMHVARTTDFSEWEYLGEIFDEDNRPTWATEDSMFWAPDIRYVGDQYVLYYTVTDTVADPGEWNYAIGAATAPTPSGPWTDSGEAVVEPRSDGSGGYFNTIDPALVTDDDGTRYLYFGGYHGGIWVTELDDSGLRTVGEPTQLTVPDRYEGAFVVKRDGYYYLTASSANCCAGPVTGYSVYVGRSESPTGPFLDHEGISMNESRVGGTQVLAQNGNNIVGVGHHTIFTDTTGQDWIIYHGIERDDPWLDDPGGVNERPSFIDRLDWIDGWPVAAGGAGPSEGALTGPTLGTALDLEMGDPAASASVRTIAGSWDSQHEGLNDAGTVGLLTPDENPARIETVRPGPDQVRVEADIRLPEETGTFGVDLGRAGARGIGVEIDTEARELRAEVSSRSGTESTVAELPATFDPGAFNALTVEVRDGGLVAALSESRLADTTAEVELEVPRDVVLRRPVAWEAQGAAVQIANLSVTLPHTPVTEPVDEPQAGNVRWADTFGDGMAYGWEWVRENEDVVIDGDLHWPLDDGDVVGPDADGALLLREPPEGEWIMETEFHLDLGEETNRNHQQAGLIVYNDDDDFLRLGQVAIGPTRQVEFGKQLADEDRLDWGAHLGGPAAPDQWLRIHHTVDPQTAELRYRSASSADGENWRWGATWTLPAGADPRVGIYAGGGAQPQTEATFKAVRFYSEADGEGAGFTNPVFAQNFPDPFVLEHDGTFYAYATNGDMGHMPVLTSTDLVEWTAAGNAMPELAPWVESGRTWAPEITELEPGRFLAYYTARDPEIGHQCIGVAEASDPLGPFVDTSSEPLICQEDEGGSIDASPFTDVDGRHYLLWKNDGNAVEARSWIYGQELASDGLSLVGEPQRLLTHDQEWEDLLIEGASVWIHEGRYYMFYSGNGYWSSQYGVGYAVADSILGPWEKPQDEPLMSANEFAEGPGHGMVLEANGRTWYVHHAWHPGMVGENPPGRTMWLAPMTFSDGVPTIEGPSQEVPTHPMDP